MIPLNAVICSICKNDWYPA